MSNVKEYKELRAFHPGYYIAEIIDEMGVSQNEFATRLGTTPKTVSMLINGQASLSKELAHKLSVMLGTSIDLWLNLQAEFDKKILYIQMEQNDDAQAKVASLIDYKYFEKVGGLTHTTNIREKVANLCRYLQISDLRILEQPDFLVNYRTSISNVEKKNLVNSRAWIQTAINYSRRISTERFNAEKLKNYLPEIRGMTIQEPSTFLPRMETIFSECGVALVLLPHLKNSGINGAVKWVSNERVVLAMNNRGLDADKFWFSLFHEIKHVLQQKIKTTFISCSISEMMDKDSELEREADAFANNYLIPRAAYARFNPSKYTSDAEIKAFAEMIGIHPGIVAGRMQHDKIVPQNRCSALKEKYYIY